MHHIMWEHLRIEYTYGHKGVIVLKWYLTGLCFYVYIDWRIAPPGFNLVIILWQSTTVFLTRGNDLWAYDIGPFNTIFRFPDHKYWPRRGHTNRHGPNQVLFQFVTGGQIVWHVRSWTRKAIGNVSHCVKEVCLHWEIMRPAYRSRTKIQS